MQTTGLVRVTVATAHRRIDMALPEHAAVAEILPGLLARAGEGLADDGVANGGWLLRRADGMAFDLDRTLASHRVRDGEILHLAQRRIDWPELEYDDLVDAIATGSGRIGHAWGPRHTRHAGLAAGAFALLLGLVAVLRAGPPWTPPALWALAVSALLLVAAVVVARAVGDAGVGTVLAAIALPFAFTGGGLLLADDKPLTGLSAGHLLVAGAMLLLVALVGQIGVTTAPAVFAGAATVGLLGVVGGWLATLDEVESYEAAAVVGGGLLALSTTFAPLALRLGRVPMPVLPRSAADLVRDDPQPRLELVHAAVARAEGLLTGMLVGSCVAVLCCQVVLIRSDSVAAVVLVGVLAAGFLLRARLYPILRHRAPLLATGIFGVGCLFAGPVMADRGALLASTGPLLLALGAGVIVAGVGYSTRTPNLYLGRFAEYAEMLIMAAIVPVACSVLGLYGYVRGLGG
ncbi:type VII secretion integral membrane protein EccD [Micromonospora polyrhachis]|uniref:Type VII secretion integral membrane protein EccD n=1 Tax=Micromonospora polyrhachis TaxID=1282883 RepID=A0A7W7SKE4_9ACTN|nr:type VII secretion integral membrane protein EccD [Micromonospora polyrhachis]MBB4956407.1 type VII secretion integral membrane protein EccD [Micromonospora polyrhachis]